MNLEKLAYENRDRETDKYVGIMVELAQVGEFVKAKVWCRSAVRDGDGFVETGERRYFSNA